MTLFRPTLTILLALSALASPVGASAQNACSRVFAERPALVLTADLKVFPKGVDPRRADGHIQVGYESEYLFKESGPLLMDYAPVEELLPRHQWNQLTAEQRIAWVHARFKDRPEFATGTGLKKMVDVEFMPDELIVDSTGNIEIVLKPMDSYPQWEKAVDYIVKKYGPGSQQAMVSKPRDAAFTHDIESSYKENFGWFVFSNLKDTYQKLASGYERYTKDPTKLTAQSFDHPFLGPMHKIKRDVMEEYMHANARGERYDADSKKFVSKSDASFKYTGGPSYRPDVAGPARFAWEIRNAHKDVADLKMKVKRDFVAHARGLERYADFSAVPAFDSLVEFARLPSPVQKTLATLFPSKANPRFKYTENELRSLEVYRNFALPGADMAPLASALKSSPAERAQLLGQIRVAQARYRSELDTVAAELESGALSPELAKARIMGALGRFSVESGISAAFEARAIVNEHEGVDLVAPVRNPAQVIELKPLKKKTPSRKSAA